MYWKAQEKRFPRKNPTSPYRDSNAPHRAVQNNLALPLILAAQLDRYCTVKAVLF